MKKLIVPALALALAMCAGSAEAVIGGLSLARSNLYNAQMRAYNAKISYYQKASLHYQQKLPALTTMKYYYLLGGSSSYSQMLLYTKLLSGKSTKSTSTKLVVPTSTAFKNAASASTVSQLMAALKGWGRY